jgi:hypothetical protein
MPLSLHKLENLLASKGFIPKTFFTLDQYCIYIEVLSIINGEYFMLYISSRYELKVENKSNIYRLTYMDLESKVDNDSSNIADKYTSDDVNLSELYNDDHFEIRDNNKDLEISLHDNYNRQLTLQDLGKEDNKTLKNIIRQIKRFQLCTQNIVYKISIFHKNFFCSITKDEELDCFIINDYVSKEEYRFCIYLDLKNLYVKINNVSNDIKTVRDGIYKLLNQNHIKHTKVLNSLLEQKTDILEYSDFIYKKKSECDTYTKQYESLLENLNKSENKIFDQIDKIKRSISEYGIRGIHEDMERTYKLKNFEKELKELQKTKQEIINNIHDLKTKKDNLTLNIDTILYDNAIMINEISKNFSKLSELVSSSK